MWKSEWARVPVIHLLRECHIGTSTAIILPYSVPYRSSCAVNAPMLRTLLHFPHATTVAREVCDFLHIAVGVPRTQVFANTLLNQDLHTTLSIEFNLTLRIHTIIARSGVGTGRVGSRRSWRPRPITSTVNSMTMLQMWMVAHTDNSYNDKLEHIHVHAVV